MPTPAADFRLDGKVALVTGAARGLGAAIALALAQAGADLALGLRDQPSGSPVVAEIAALGRRVRTYPMDLFSLDQVRTAIRQAQQDFGRIDILVNNAGIGEPNLAEVVTERDFDDTLAVNLKGTFFASQEAGRIMIAQNSGTIVNLSSQAGFIALPSEFDLLHDQGRHLSPDEVPGPGVGAVSHHRQCGCAYLHPYPRHPQMAGRSAERAVRAAAHPPRADRRSSRCSWSGGLPGIAGSRIDYRRNFADRRRLDHPVGWLTDS